MAVDRPGHRVDCSIRMLFRDHRNGCLDCFGTNPSTEGERGSSGLARLDNCGIIDRLDCEHAVAQPSARFRQVSIWR